MSASSIQWGLHHLGVGTEFGETSATGTMPLPDQLKSLLYGLTLLASMSQDAKDVTKSAYVSSARRLRSTKAFCM